MDFTTGSHHFRDAFIPHDEIWMDSANRCDEFIADIMHEHFERTLMAEEGTDYNTTHDWASAFEFKARRSDDPLAMLRWVSKSLVLAGDLRGG